MIGVFLTIARDTWRQSVHQWVLLLLLGALAVFVPVVIAFPEVKESSDGTKFLGRIIDEGPRETGLEQGWEGLYADVLRDERSLDELETKSREEMEASVDVLEQADYRVKELQHKGAGEIEIAKAMQVRRDAEAEVDARTAAYRKLRDGGRDWIDQEIRNRTGHISRLQKGVEFWLSSNATFLFIISMLGFIAACAGYIPNMLEAGSIDLLLSKPVRRWQLFFGKYVGGLAVYSVALLLAYVAIFVGVGARTGIWHWPFFGALPMTIFSMALLYAIVGWVGLWTRSTGLSIVLGYVYYLVVDTAVSYLADSGSMPFLADIPAIKEAARIMKLMFPSFRWLREAAEASVFSVMVVPWQHVGVGVAWLVVCLGTAYNRFRINDY